MNCLGVILARGGSKRCPGKNLRELGGRTLIDRAVEGGKCAQLIDTLIVSSDDDAILTEARRCRVDTIKRPAALATDEASSYPAMLHALNSYDEHFDYLCLLQPTSPFRHPYDIDACILSAYECGLAAVVSVTHGCSVPNGAVYVGRTDWLMDGGNFDSDVPEKYYMHINRSIDIDTESDFSEAEAMV